MIFQFVYGVKDLTVRVYGYPSGSVTIDGTTHNLNASGYKDVTLKKGNHTFVDGHVGTNSKTLDISNDCTVVVGLLVGTISQFASNAVHTTAGATAYGSSSVTKSIPAGNIAPVSYAKVTGQVRARQTVSGTNYGPGCSATGSISVDGTAIDSSTSSSLAYASFSTERYTGWAAISGTKAITEKTSGTVTATMSTSVTTTSNSLTTYSYADGSASEIYVY